MSKKQGREEAEEAFKEVFEPTSQEVENLRVALSKYEQKRINGKLQSKFEQHCKTNGVLYFDEHGELVLTNPTEYHRLLQIYNKLHSKEYWEQEEYLKTHPEEQEKMLELRAKMNAEMGKKFGISYATTD